MEINNADIVFEIARRTIHNLDHVSKLAFGQDERDPQVFETTQLLNSFLGLLVLPKELWLDKQPDESLATLWSSGWPKPVFETNTVGCSMLRQFMELLRHSIAHGNIEFAAEQRGNGYRISHMRFWNHPDGKAKLKPINFKILFKVEQAEDFARKLAGRILMTRVRDVSKKLIEPVIVKVA